MYYLLDRNGNIVTSYKTTIQAAEAFNTTPNVFSRISRNISDILNNIEPSNGALMVKEIYSFVKQEDYINHETKIRWILTKDDILAINRKGVVIAEYKTLAQCLRSLSGHNITSSSSGLGALNVINKESYNHRLATREHYMNMVKEDVLCYTKEFDNSGGLKKTPLDMYNVKTGEFIRDFESLTDAAFYMGCSKEGVRLAAVEGRELLDSGFYFKYKKEI